MIGDATVADDRLIVALDHDDAAPARACVQALDGWVGRFKVGSALFTRAGAALVTELTAAGHRVFLDLKFHDTPKTVESAVAAAAALGADMLTVHAAGGDAMLAAARRAADREGGPAGGRPRLLAVTVLTSLSAEDYRRVAGPGAPSLAEAALALARMAIQAGVDGVVCSAGEAASLRAALGPGPLLVVPGIRPAWSAADHSGQARTSAPGPALRAGASHLVVGRAITGATDPARAAERILAEMTAAG